MAEFALGIDLGTTFSCVAVHFEGRTEIIPEPNGFTTLPSIVFIGGTQANEFIIGRDAVDKLATHPAQTIVGAKRLLGRQASPEESERIQAYFPYKIASDANGELVIDVLGQRFAVVDISAKILHYLKENAKNYLGRDVDKAVISVPAYFTQRQREAVRLAGERAGLTVLRIVNEPTAAAMAYGAGKKNNEKILVYDLGGGTFDVTILELRDKVYEVLATGGDDFLGGLDFDKAIRDYFRRQFEEQNQVSLEGDFAALQRLMTAAEEAKIAVSKAEQALVRIPFLAKSGDKLPKRLGFETVITRQQINEICKDLIEQTLIITSEVLVEAGLSAEDIGDVVLVGGMTRFPAVRQRVSEYFKRTPNTNLNPDECVAVGAAILADAILNKSELLELVDVVPVSIGVTINFGPYETVIHRNSKVPLQVERTVPTSVDYQSGMSLRIYQGESPNPADNTYLGELTITGIPPLPKGQVEVVLEFSLDSDAILAVSAREAKTNQQLINQFSTAKPVEVAQIRRDLQPTAAPTPAAPFATTPEVAAPASALTAEPSLTQTTTTPATELAQPTIQTPLVDAAATLLPDSPKPEPAQASSATPEAEIVEEAELAEAPLILDEAPTNNFADIQTSAQQAQKIMLEIEKLHKHANERFASAEQAAGDLINNPAIASLLEEGGGSLGLIGKALTQTRALHSEIEFAATAVEANQLLQKAQQALSESRAALTKIDDLVAVVEKRADTVKAARENEKKQQDNLKLQQAKDVASKKITSVIQAQNNLEARVAECIAKTNLLTTPNEDTANILTRIRDLATHCAVLCKDAQTAASNASQATALPAAVAAIRQLEYLVEEHKNTSTGVLHEIAAFEPRLAELLAAQERAAAQARQAEQLAAARQAATAATASILSEAELQQTQMQISWAGAQAKANSSPVAKTNAVQQALEQLAALFKQAQEQINQAMTARQNMAKAASNAAVASAQTELLEHAKAHQTTVQAFSKAIEALNHVIANELLAAEKAAQTAQREHWIKQAAQHANAALNAAAKVKATVEDILKELDRLQVSGPAVQTALVEARQAAAKADAAANLAREAAVAAEHVADAAMAEAKARQAQTALHLAEAERNSVVALFETATSAAQEEFNQRRAAAEKAAQIEVEKQLAERMAAEQAAQTLAQQPSAEKAKSEKTTSEVKTASTNKTKPPPIAAVENVGENASSSVEEQNLGNAALGRIKLEKRPLEATASQLENPAYQDLAQIVTVKQSPQLEIVDDEAPAVDTLVVQVDEYAADVVDLGDFKEPTSAHKDELAFMITEPAKSTSKSGSDDHKPEDEAIGRYLLKKGVITDDQLAAAIDHCNAVNKTFAAFALAEGYLSKSEVQNVEREQAHLDKKYDYKTFSETVVHMGILSQDEVDEIEKKRRASGLDIGQALVKLGYLTASALNNELAAFKAAEPVKINDLKLPVGLRKPTLVKIFATICAKCCNELADLNVQTNDAQVPTAGAYENKYATFASDIGGDITARFALSFDQAAAQKIAPKIDASLLDMLSEPSREEILNALRQFCSQVVEQCAAHISAKSSFRLTATDPEDVSGSLKVENKVVAIDFSSRQGQVRLIWTERG